MKMSRKHLTSKTKDNVLFALMGSCIGLTASFVLVWGYLFIAYGYSIATNVVMLFSVGVFLVLFALGTVRSQLRRTEKGI
jgi:hypothetical protein